MSRLTLRVALCKFLAVTLLASVVVVVSSPMMWLCLPTRLKAVSVPKPRSRQFYFPAIAFSTSSAFDGNAELNLISLPSASTT